MAEAVWGRVYTEIMPSGERVRVRRISIINLLWAGGFPAELTGLVWKMFNEKVDAKALVAEPEGIARMVGIIEQVIPHVLISPKVGDKTDLSMGDDGVIKGTVALADIPDLDKQWLMLFGQGLILSSEERAARGDRGDKEKGAPGPQSFRGESVRDDAGSAGAEVQPAALGDGGAVAGQPTGS